MIDWSDPMPGTNFFVKGHRNWIEPNQAIHSERYLMSCLDRGGSPQTAQVQLSSIMFDDGSGEGDSNQLKNFLRNRQQLRDERLKWITRFSQLRNGDDLHTAAAQLYEDLTKAKHEAEADPDTAPANRIMLFCLEELQNIALELTQYGKVHKKLDEGSRQAWMLTDLEQRTARLVRGAGTGNPQVEQY
jgi:hypothetical protein